MAPIISLGDAYAALTFLPNRTPETTATDWASQLTEYRDGAMFVAHYAGQSEWERHGVGDEIVIVIEGATTLTMLVDGEEIPHQLGSMEMVIVPQGVWHRFDTPEEVRVLSVTPQPTDHQTERPG